MHRVAEAFANLLPDVLPYTDDVAGGAHTHYLSVVRHTVEGGVHQQPPFPKEGFYVVRNLHIRGIHGAVLDDDSVKFKHVIHTVLNQKARRMASFSNPLNKIIMNTFLQ